jgi:hypothetical protein
MRREWSGSAQIAKNFRKTPRTGSGRHPCLPLSGTSSQQISVKFAKNHLFLGKTALFYPWW